MKNYNPVALSPPDNRRIRKWPGPNISVRIYHATLLSNHSVDFRECWRDNRPKDDLAVIIEGLTAVERLILLLPRPCRCFHHRGMESLTSLCQGLWLFHSET